jgi:hypothetical protein
MAKVLNKTDRSLPVERWTLFAGGTKCMDNNGKIREELPDNVAYGPIVRHLLAQDLVSFGGIQKKIAKSVTFTGEIREIDMTSGQSKSQRKKLRGEQRS